MSDWHCFKDKVKMSEENVPLRYLQLERRVPGLKCPVCGALYLTEHVVRTIVRTAEEYIELK